VPLTLVKPTIDLGIVTADRAASKAFYGGTLGLPELEELRMDGFSISRFQVGDCVLKILEFDQPPRAKAAPGGLGAATGVRYWTVSVSNLGEVLEACRAAGRPVADGPTEIRPGVIIAMVEDPDGNLVEFVNRSAS
jgi:lactoylglutathione lyase